MSDQTGVTQNSSSPQGERPVWSLLSTINAANNQITTSGYTYDAAGNMTNDTVHSYAYDAEGNITKVDGGSTAQYVYDVFNHRIHVQTASATNEFVYDPMGRRVSTWLSPNNYGSEGRIRWDGRQIGYRSTDGTTYFDHQDMLGTERMRTTYSGTVGSTYTSLPWGDGYTATVNTTGADQDNGHFAGLDRDAESDTEHAQFRNYASAQGRWLAPDSYLGSYDLTNPQSMNRYAYALNNPTSSIDPSGLEDEQGCGDDDDCGGDGGSGDGGPPLGCSPSCTDQNGNGYTGTSTGGISGGPGTTVDVNADTGNNGFDGSYLDGGNIPQDPNGPGNAPNKTLGTCRVGSTPSHSQYASAFGSVAAMTAQFFSGLGPVNNTFGSGSAVSQVMAQSPGVQDAINGYNIFGKTSGNYNFGVSGAFAAGNNIVAQFVGGYSYSISGASGGINLSLSNYTSFRSLAADIGPSWARPAPMGTTHQTYNLFIPCP
jgi:RHS repeat-associated protein